MSNFTYTIGNFCSGLHYIYINTNIFDLSSNESLNLRKENLLFFGNMNATTSAAIPQVTSPNLVQIGPIQFGFIKRETGEHTNIRLILFID